MSVYRRPLTKVSFAAKRKERKEEEVWGYFTIISTEDYLWTLSHLNIVVSPRRRLLNAWRCLVRGSNNMTHTVTTGLRLYRMPFVGVERRTDKFSICNWLDCYNGRGGLLSICFDHIISLMLAIISAENLVRARFLYRLHLFFNLNVKFIELPSGIIRNCRSALTITTIPTPFP